MADTPVNEQSPLDRLCVVASHIQVHTLAMCALVTAGEPEIAAKMSYLAHELADEVLDLTQAADRARSRFRT